MSFDGTLGVRTTEIAFKLKTIGPGISSGLNNCCRAGLRPLCRRRSKCCNASAFRKSALAPLYRSAKASDPSLRSAALAAVRTAMLAGLLPRGALGPRERGALGLTLMCLLGLFTKGNAPS
eukprot:1187669-Prorocentrum_minimum.AAC.1